MNATEVFRRYQELQVYVGWTDEAARLVVSVAGLVGPHLPALVEDFYAEIDRHPDARKVITGGAAQVERLKGTLLTWLHELFGGRYDAEYVARRWRVGGRHVEIGLDQVYANAALSRVRSGLVRLIQRDWRGDPAEGRAVVRALNTLLDLDLAIIEDAYQAAHVERQRRAERLATQARSDAAFRALVESAPSLIVILRRDHSIVYVNRCAEEVTGHETAALLGADFCSVLLPADAGPALAAGLEAAADGGAVREFEHPVACKDGSRRWVLWNARHLADYQGGEAVLVIGQDVTALKQAQERTLQAERLAAIGQMVAGLAHESGNALARAQACLEILALEVHDRPEALDVVGRVQKAQDHLHQLYEEVRNYAAPLKLEREPCRLDSVWRQAWSNLAVRRQGREAHLREEYSGVELCCSGDAFRLEQVFRNVFENALAACRDPVEVTVRCQIATLDGRPAILLSIRDNGPGLNAEQARRIFEPFYTTRTKGTGLGMPIAKRIVEAHGGRIGIGPGSGAEILITLPRD